ncbi:MAG: SAM-dependent methyltransferase [Acidimicrobiia bacterium]
MATVGKWSSLIRRRPPDFATPVSMVASGVHTEHPDYVKWVPRLEQPHGRHRKVWEWCFILNAFERHGLLVPGKTALGFGVGTEAVVPLLARHGVGVTATDQSVEQAGAWATVGQHAAVIDALRRPSICADDDFDELVTFRSVDMRTIPDDLRGFDATWSSCCFEHLGSKRAGFDFVMDSLRTLKPGGVAVHTTEFDCTRGRPPLLETGTVAAGDYCCFFRSVEIEELVDRVRAEGHRVTADLHVGRRHPYDRHVDRVPYTGDPHIRLAVLDRVVTSVGLVIEVAG